MANESSVLARKIALAKSTVSPSVNTDGFARDLETLSAKAASALLEAECAAVAKPGTGALGAIVQGGADPGVYYWLTDASGEAALLVAIDPNFANLMTVRLLGGELSDASETAAASAVEFEMSASLIDMLEDPLNALLHKPSAAPRLSSAGRRGVRTLKEVLRERETLAVSAFAFDIIVEGKPFPKALSLIFANTFLKQAGVLSSGAQPRKERDPKWAPALRRNVLNTEIPLSIVLDRLMTSVGDLSRLQVGQVIDLDPNALASLEIAASTSAGPAHVARGRLGSWQSRKAVKLTSDIDPDFVRGL